MACGSNIGGRRPRPGPVDERTGADRSLDRFPSAHARRRRHSTDRVVHIPRKLRPANAGVGMGCLLMGAIVLSWSGTPTLANLIGPIAIVGACIAWGFDNNFTRKVSPADPLQVVELKGLIAGPVESCAWRSCWRIVTRPLVNPDSGVGWSSRLRNRSRAVRHGVKTSRDRTHRRLFFDRAVSWHSRGRDLPT